MANKTKDQLLEEAKALGVDVNDRMTVADLKEEIKSAKAKKDDGSEENGEGDKPEDDSQTTAKSGSKPAHADGLQRSDRTAKEGATGSGFDKDGKPTMHVDELQKRREQAGKDGTAFSSFNNGKPVKPEQHSEASQLGDDARKMPDNSPKDGETPQKKQEA